MKNRVIRFPDHIWEGAREKAAAANVPLSDVIRALVKLWLDDEIEVTTEEEE